MTGPAVGRSAAILGLAGLRLTAGEAKFFQAADPFGFILFARNVDNPDQVRRLTAELRHAVGRDAPIFVDQEGGRVQRLRAPYWSEFLPPQEAVAQAKACGGMPAALRMMELRYRLIAAELRDVGIDGNCAPCLDVLTDDTHPFLKNRCYSADPAEVSAFGKAVVEAHLAGGVLPVIKHMPGHGRAVLDSHKDLPIVADDPEALDDTDFAPFRALSDVPLAMTAHIVFSAFDRRPATLSPAVIRMIRDQIGFDGLLMTDDLNMKALRGSAADKVARAIAAGCDLALFCKGPVSQMERVVLAAGDMRPATLARARRAIEQRTAPIPVDLNALRAEHSGLLGGMGDV